MIGHTIIRRFASLANSPHYAIIGNDIAAYSAALMLSKGAPNSGITLVSPKPFQYINHQIISDKAANQLSSLISMQDKLYPVKTMHLIEEKGTSDASIEAGKQFTQVQFDEVFKFLKMFGFESYANECCKKGIQTEKLYNINALAVSNELLTEIKKTKVNIIDNCEISSIAIDKPLIKLTNNKSIECTHIIDAYKHGTEYRRPHKLEILINSPNTSIYHGLASISENINEAYFKTSSTSYVTMIPFKNNTAYIAMETSSNLNISTIQDLIIQANKALQQPPQASSPFCKNTRTYPPIILNPLSALESERGTHVVSHHSLYDSYMVIGDAAHYIEPALSTNFNLAELGQVCNSIIENGWDTQRIRKDCEHKLMHVSNGYYKLYMMMKQSERCDCEIWSTFRNIFKSMLGSKELLQFCWNLIISQNYLFVDEYKWAVKK